MATPSRPKGECEFAGEIARIRSRVNLASLPQQRSSQDSVLEAFDRLEPGTSLLVVDEVNLEWVRDFLEQQRPDSFDRRFFHLHDVAGRKEACVKKRVDVDS